MVDLISKGALSPISYPCLARAKQALISYQIGNTWRFKFCVNNGEVFAEMFKSSSEFVVIRKICRNLETFNLIRSRLVLAIALRYHAH